MGLRDSLESRWQRSRDALEQAATAVGASAKAARSGLTDGTAKAAVERAIIEKYPQPSLPLEQDWEVSISALVGQVPRMPTAAVKLLRLLNRFGAVRLGVDEVGFDGDTIAWSKVTQIRTHRLSDVLTGSLLEVEVERLSRLVPPVPGRRWVVTRVGELLFTLARMSTGISGSDQSEPAEDTGEADDPRVAVDIVYHGRIRQEVHNRAGLTAALLLTAMPQAHSVLMTLAEQRDIPVVASEEQGVWDAAGDRTEAMRSTIAAMRSRFTDTSNEREAP